MTSAAIAVEFGGIMEEALKQERAKVYQRKKQQLTLFHLFFTPFILWIVLATPFSRILRDFSLSVSPCAYVAVGLYFLLFSLAMLVFDLPLSFYSGYLLEHKFELSNESLGAWAVDLLKKSVLSFVLSLVLIWGLYALVWNFPNHWWVLAWVCFAFVSYGMGKLFPILIVPLFYKYSPLADEDLRSRILTLAARFKLSVSQVYSLNLSKTTKKANAAFMGMGKTKRVVLSDTLLQNFTADEIESVVAHELGHYVHRDIWKHLLFGLGASFLSFWIAFQGIGILTAAFHLKGASDIAALPALFLLFYAVSLVLMPLQNGFSRWMERGADRFSLENFSKPEAFSSCMKKLAMQNLANPDPDPLYEWFFYDHPSIGKRLRMAEAWASERSKA